MDYQSQLASILFTLRHGAQCARLPGWDEDIANQVLTEAARFTAAEIDPLDGLTERAPLVLEEGRVKLPPHIVAAYRAYRDAGWPTLAGAEEHGGQHLPHVLASAVSEMLAGASLSFQLLIGLTAGAIRVITSSGTPEQRAAYLPRLVSGEWLSTMCLTEPQAGSDLGQTRTIARPQADGGYLLSGDKIFISGGDQNLTDNIVHLVLARTPGAAAGVKGLSLFLAPAVLPDGRRNAIACLRLEEKMGLHGSPTCQLAFDDAEARMLGGEGEGLARMFEMMNAARIEVGVQGVALAEVAAQRSRIYAAGRRQGKGGDGAGPVPLHRHADVRRMLLTQMALVEGCRALVYRVDVEHELGANQPLVDFLTPVCKAFASDSAVEAAQLAIQIHGGYGYLTEYRVEQILRDARITQIYEGANGIQAITLADRLLRMAGGAPREAFAREVEDAMEAAPPVARGALGDAKRHWEDASAALMSRSGAGAAAIDYLRLTGLLAAGAAWGRLEAAADQAPHPARTRAAAAFFREAMLPECGHLARRVVQGIDVGVHSDEVFNA
ncbi:acyl-CoA dehydrogenase family protein [Pseudoduganella namucuonensis]|uniref:Acyl-CoA dehydrogenase n=1 Tax=Pseudoduganella namucuonensis TaxID=1035707 RepID=A0A1I7LDR9_9BURK|nr:acyl-CoA dehydrogenase family protein [Pseudoduganella namucuonensis]SFV07829.1 hypothetical protein SAMN05216552_102749 [Pseudoduganella namucuonensis]